MIIIGMMMESMIFEWDEVNQEKRELLVQPPCDGSNAEWRIQLLEDEIYALSRRSWAWVRLR